MNDVICKLINSKIRSIKYFKRHRKDRENIFCTKRSPYEIKYLQMFVFTS